MKRRTKIVATLGPSSQDKGEIRALVEAGMNIVRINSSHGTYEEYKEICTNIRTIEKESDKTVSTMLDLQGPKIRIGELSEPILVQKGEELTFTTKKGKPGIYIPYPALAKIVKKGQKLLIEDGLIRTKILSTKPDQIKVQVLAGGYIKSKKGVNVPDSSLPSSAALTKKDKEDIKFGIQKLKVDAIAVSFVEDPSDIERVRKQVAKYTTRPILIFAKIERKEALKKIEKIIDVSDGIMVARGDLGIEIRAEMVPIEQKRMLAIARMKGKPVIIATQILASMVNNPLATRAEISDAANAIFEHADAFMLSNETAVGDYPIKSVSTLARVARVTEQAIFKEKELFPVQTPSNLEEIDDETIALNAAIVAEEIDAEAIVVLTKHGFTARTVVKHRPKTPIIVVTNNKYTARAMNFLWGIKKVIVVKGKLRSEEAINELVKKKILKKNDDVVAIKLSDNKRSLVVMHV